MLTIRSISGNEKELQKLLRKLGQPRPLRPTYTDNPEHGMVSQAVGTPKASDLYMASANTLMISPTSQYAIDQEVYVLEYNRIVKKKIKGKCYIRRTDSIDYQSPLEWHYAFGIDLKDLQYIEESKLHATVESLLLDLKKSTEK